MPNVVKAVRFEMRASEDWLRHVDDWRRKQSDIPPRAEAIRRLTAIGIEAEPIMKELLDFFERHGDPADAETQANITRLRGIVSG